MSDGINKEAYLYWLAYAFWVGGLNNGLRRFYKLAGGKSEGDLVRAYREGVNFVSLGNVDTDREHVVDILYTIAIADKISEVVRIDMSEDLGRFKRCLGFLDA